MTVRLHPPCLLHSRLSSLTLLPICVDGRYPCPPAHSCRFYHRALGNTTTCHLSPVLLSPRLAGSEARALRLHNPEVVGSWPTQAALKKRNYSNVTPFFMSKNEHNANTHTLRNVPDTELCISLLSLFHHTIANIIGGQRLHHQTEDRLQRVNFPQHPNRS